MTAAATLEGCRLSPQQQRLWQLGRDAEPGAFRVRCAVEIAGDLDLEALSAAFDRVVGRHEILRTGFSTLEGMTLPLQVPSAPPRLGRLAAAEPAPPWPVHCRGLEGADGGPPVIAAVAPTAGGHRLLLSLSELATDRAGVRVLVRELAGEYGGGQSGVGGGEGGETLQYADLTEWLHAVLTEDDDDLEPLRQRWRGLDLGDQLALRLPFEAARPGPFAPRSIAVPEAAECLERCAEAAERIGVGRPAVLQALWRTLLWRHLERTDLAVATAFDGRCYDELEALPGRLERALPVVCRLDPERPLGELARTVDAELAAAAEAQEVFALDEIAGAGPGDRPPALPLAFVDAQPATGSPAAEAEVTEAAGVRFSVLGIEAWSERFTVALSAAAGSGSPPLAVAYDAGRLGAPYARTLADQLGALAASAAADPDRPLSRLSPLSAGERQRRVVEIHARGAAGEPEPVHRLFERRAAADPGAVAVAPTAGGGDGAAAGEAIAYGALEARANRLARRLRGLGVGPERVVGVALERGPEQIAALLAVLKAGGAYLPLDPSYPPARLAFVAADAGARLVLADDDGTAGRFGDGVEVVRCDRGAEDAASDGLEDPGPPPGETHPEQLAYVLYTSGSTGRPKGVPVSHRALAAYVRWCLAAYGLEPGSRVPYHSPLGFDLTVTSLFPPLAAGAAIVPVDAAAGVDGLGAALASGGFDLVKLTPAHLEILNRGPEPAAAGPRTVVVGGEQLFAEAAGRWLARHPGSVLINEYGPTEATVGCSVHRLTADDDLEPGPVPIGGPIPGARLYVLGPGAEPCPTGVPGELVVGGPGVARGYLGRPALTAERFVPDPLSGEPGARLYRTGDRARFRPDGALEFLGRGDRQIKLRGYRIEPGEIEAALLADPAIAEAAVEALPGAGGEPRLVAYLVPATAPPPAAEAAPAECEAALRSRLAESLPAHMVPAAWVLLPRLPLDAHGKVDRRALPPPPEAPVGAAAAPATPVEEVIAGFWCEVLGRERVGRGDGFFDLGGHSLLATRVLARVRRAFGLELPVRTLFDAPTLSGFAAAVERALVSGASGAGAGVVDRPPLEPVPRPGPQPVTLPLSLEQERLWFVHRIDPESPAYNVTSAVRLLGALDPAVLDRVLSELVRRHEALRTTLATVDGKPVQRIHRPRPWRAARVDLTALAAGRRRVEAGRVAARLERIAFDLERWPLARLTLIRLGPDEHAAVFSLHHVIADGWSLAVLVREVATLYPAFADGRPSPLPELTVQYADYAHWQRRWLRGEVLDRLLGYWVGKLRGAPERVELPADRPPPETPSFRGAYHAFRVPGETVAGLRRLVREEGATLFMVLLAGFKALLHRTSGQADLVVGTDTANRGQVELEGVVGFFINQLVLRTDLSGDPTFRELLGRVRRVTLEAYAHQELPFLRLVKELRPRRELSRVPVFHVLIVLQNAPSERLELPGLAVEPMPLASASAKFDLALFLSESDASESDAGIAALWNYSTDLFDAATVRSMSEHLVEVLARVAAEPDLRLHRLDVFSPADKERFTMTSMPTRKLKIDRLRGARRPSVDLSQVDLVKTGHLAEPASIPWLVEPAIDDVDLAEWAAAERARIDSELRRWGAVLFRGFGIDSVPKFEAVARGLCDELYGDYGDLPSEEEGEKVYHSTPYPADKTILFHNESSHLDRWPTKQWFYCVQAAREGGETPIADCREIYRRLDPELRETFERQGLVYVRNFIPGLDVSWQDFFKTDDRGRVEERCRAAGIEIDWTGDGLRTRKWAPAVTRHPVTGDKAFFNQVELHHPYFLDPEVRESMASVFSADRLPRNVLFGDGSPIPEDVMAEVAGLYWEVSVSFPWRAGDVLMVDNMLTAHARKPFVGPRKIVVAMGDLIGQAELGNGGAEARDA